MVAWGRRNAIAVLALFVALGGTGYAAGAIDGKSIENATISGKKLKKNTLGGRQVKESKLGKVPRARHADSATVADTATSAGAAAPTGTAGGDLAGSYPNPTLAKSATPVDIAANPNQATNPCDDESRTLILCGTSAQRWLNGGFGVAGLQVWKDRLGQVHIRGSASISTGNLSGALFRLPGDLRPPRRLGFPVVTGDAAGTGPGGSGLFIIQPAGAGGGADGLALLYQPSEPTQEVVHLGEIVYRTDA